VQSKADMSQLNLPHGTNNKCLYNFCSFYFVKYFSTTIYYTKYTVVDGKGNDALTSYVAAAAVRSEFVRLDTIASHSPHSSSRST